MIGKGIILKRIRERGVNDMKIKVVRSLLLVATVLSIGVSSVPVMAVDISPDTDISVDADDSSAVAPDDSGTTVSPDNNGTSVTPDNSGSVITPDNSGTVIAPDNGNGITPDNPQQTVTPTPIPSVSGTPVDGVPKVTWDLQYDNTGEEGNYGLVRLKPSVTEGGHIVCAYKVDGNWGTHYVGSTITPGKTPAQGTTVTYTDSMDTWTILYTSSADTEKEGVRGADTEGYYSFDLNHGWNRNIPGKHRIEFYYYFWFDDLQKGSEVFLSTFDADFTDGTVNPEDDLASDISINVALKSQNAWSKTYTVTLTTQGSDLIDYSVYRVNDEDYPSDTLDDCKGYKNFSFEKTFSMNGKYTIEASSTDGTASYDLDITGIDEGAVPDDGDNVSGDDVVVSVPKLTVSGVPAVGSVDVGQTINLVVTSDKVCLSTSKSWAPRCKAYAKKMYNETNTYLSGKSKYNPKLANELRKFNKQRFDTYNKAIDNWFYKMSKKQRAKYGSNIVGGGANGHSYALMTSYVDSCFTKKKMSSDPFYCYGELSCSIRIDDYGDKNQYRIGTLKLNSSNRSDNSPNVIWNEHIQWKKW